MLGWLLAPDAEVRRHRRQRERERRDLAEGGEEVEPTVLLRLLLSVAARCALDELLGDGAGAPEVRRELALLFNDLRFERSVIILQYISVDDVLMLGHFISDDRFALLQLYQSFDGLDSAAEQLVTLPNVLIVLVV